MTTTIHGRSKTIIALVWTAQIVLAGTMLWAGYLKLFLPAAELAAMWPWTGEHPALCKFTGVVDFLAGIGLIFPVLLNILPWLTIFTAYASIALLISGSVFHIVRGEVSSIGVNCFLIVIASFIIWGRKG